MPEQAARQVLVVDDEAGIRRALALVLGGLGMRVILADDGRQAVEAFLRHADALHAVIMDIGMPGLDGFGALKQMRAIRPDVPVILMSAEAPMRPSPARASAFLEKPFSYAMLRAALARVAPAPSSAGAAEVPDARP